MPSATWKEPHKESNLKFKFQILKRIQNSKSRFSSLRKVLNKESAVCRAIWNSRSSRILFFIEEVKSLEDAHSNLKFKFSLSKKPKKSHMPPQVLHIQNSKFKREAPPH